MVRPSRLRDRDRCRAAIPLVDEILSVGYLEFQRKCMARIDMIVGAGATLVLVWYSPKLMQQLCRHALGNDVGG